MPNKAIFFDRDGTLNEDVDYLYERGSMYMCYNGNLLFHAHLIHFKAVKRLLVLVDFFDETGILRIESRNFFI